ncbi:hypothetical protein SAMN05192588_0048 [Nonlabens sp. Hel1_33_55]|uniref:DUF6588 family protein n=1 Tax=Nonlabens sp. Hel1_33_55 TaxID=1336802 RepID=UPI000875D98A|nr:DUF6588 family protein [Nonlabens sp. Hel1_33_55]SCX87636.1 hypothetical protein SAMN05192588_0048 [Nonlabens sp. Hel1_33_55]
MKKYIVTLAILISFNLSKAQDGISDVLAAGVEAAALFTNSYTEPAAEAFSYNLSAGWYDDARVLPKGKFNFIVRAQATFSKDEDKSFLLDPLVYQDIIQNSYDNTNNPPADVTVTFGDDSTTPRLIATALGQNDPSQSLVIITRDRTTGIQTDRSVIELPQGLGDAGVDVVPSAFIQAGFGLGAGLELKARFVPRTQIDEAEIAIYGGAIQWQVSDVLDKNDVLPVEVSVLAGYSVLDAMYDFEDGAVVDGEDQRLETKSGSLTLSLIAGTDFKVLNFYGGVNFNAGTTETDLLGTYTVRSSGSIFPIGQTFEDPISVKTDVSSMLGTVGTKLTLGFFQINAGYTFGEFDTLNGAIAFKF